jgi:hypothetical protein
MKPFSLHRGRTCDEPVDGRRCPAPIAGGYDPLDFCAAHLAMYRERIRTGRYGEYVAARAGQATPLDDDAPTLVLDFTGAS